METTQAAASAVRQEALSERLDEQLTRMAEMIEMAERVRDRVTGDHSLKPDIPSTPMPPPPMTIMRKAAELNGQQCTLRGLLIDLDRAL